MFVGTNLADGQKQADKSLSKLLEAIQETEEDLNKHTDKKTANTQTTLTELLLRFSRSSVLSFSVTSNIRILNVPEQSEGHDTVRLQEQFTSQLLDDLTSPVTLER